MVTKNINKSTNELWQLAYNWLKLLGNNPNAKYCREEITTHPDYPSLIAIVDLLDAGNMQYQAVQADASYIHEFNYPLLAHIKEPGNEYMHTIINVAQWDKQKEITQHWSGITVFPEKGAAWQNEQNRAYSKAALRSNLFAIALGAIGLGLFVAVATYHFSVASVSFGLLSLLGLVISVLTLGTELGYKSQLVKQVCGAVSAGGCEKVLKSPFAKGFFGITPADAAVLYFGVQFIIFLSSAFFPYFFNGLLLIAFAGIPVAVWSIYTQAVKVKQWCTLCLGIVGVTVAQAVIASVIFNTANFESPYLPFILFASLALFFALILLPIKNLITNNNRNRLKLAELKKWKTDAGLFMNQLQQEQQVDTTIWENDLLLGDPDAPIMITVACSPYCYPCALAHKELDELLIKFSSKIKIRLRMLCHSESTKDTRTIALKTILAVNENKGAKEFQACMLSDWFEWMDIDYWSKKWQPDSIDSEKIMKQLKKHESWFQNSKIIYTPTFFVNDRKLPSRYNVEDLALLIPELVEKFT